MVQDLVGRRCQTASAVESEVCGNEEVGEVFSGEVSGDWLVVTGRASVFENSLVVSRVNPDEAKDSGAQGGIGGAEVCDSDVGFGGGGDSSEIEGGVGVAGAADGDQSVAGEW
jgi:hypothetical protein